ncbi:unnamed protein product, partial [Echinostoma caproni]|uniref:Polyprotein n=1 Tax=Echinostoma caproni TaxID=27848 RepID=A0A183B9A7_9TREM
GAVHLLCQASIGVCEHSGISVYRCRNCEAGEGPRAATRMIAGYVGVATLNDCMPLDCFQSHIAEYGVTSYVYDVFYVVTWAES